MELEESLELLKRGLKAPKYKKGLLRGHWPDVEDWLVIENDIKKGTEDFRTFKLRMKVVAEFHRFREGQGEFKRGDTFKLIDKGDVLSRYIQLRPDRRPYKDMLAVILKKYSPYLRISCIKFD